MSISITTNFNLNQSTPIDSRMVATNSSTRENILYKYVGLKVYQIDNGVTYLWNGNSWIAEGSGVYGSGSLVGDINLNFGSIGQNVGSESNDLNFQSNDSILTNKFYRTTAGNNYTGIEWRNQLNFLQNNTIQNSSYIGFNSQHSTRYGDITINTGTPPQERFRVTQDGRVGINTQNPDRLLDVNGSFRSNTIDSGTTSLTSLQVSGTTNLNNLGLQTLATNFTASVGGNLIVSGRITNSETQTLLVPIQPVIWSNNGNFNGSNGGTHSLSSFTYSFNFYRVGAIVQCNFTITKIGNTTYPSGFWGWLFRFDNIRFRPSSIAYGNGYGGFVSQTNNRSQYAPIFTSIFTSDPTTLNLTTPTSTQFYLKVNTFWGLNTNANVQGGDFGNAQSMTDLTFRGSITYVCSDVDISGPQGVKPDTPLTPIDQI